MTDDLASERTLRPSLRRRVPFLVLSALLLALSITSVFFAPLLGAAGVLLFGFATVNALFRMIHPLSYATVLGPEAFVTHSALGKPVHRVRWAEVAHLTVFDGNGFGGPGTVRHLAWRCEPRQPGRGRQPWVRGGRNEVGEEFDGALPDPYLGIESMLALFEHHADAGVARAGSSEEPPEEQPRRAVATRARAGAHACELGAALADLAVAVRSLGLDEGADWIAVRAARADRDPEGVRSDVRQVMGGMGSLSDLPVDTALIRRVSRAVGFIDSTAAEWVAARPEDRIGP